jgi:hypothetical protein
MYFRVDGKKVDSIEGFDFGFGEGDSAMTSTCGALKWLSIVLLILAGFIGLWLMFDAANKKNQGQTRTSSPATNAFDIISFD